MADEQPNVTIEELRRFWAEKRPRPFVSRKDEVELDFYNLAEKLIGIIEAQDARIKALEDRLNSFNQWPPRRP